VVKRIRKNSVERRKENKNKHNKLARKRNTKNKKL
jgi:hypothetical protein